MLTGFANLSAISTGDLLLCAKLAHQGADIVFRLLKITRNP